MMVVTNHPRNLPSPILVLPQMNEQPLTHALRILMPRMMKPVHPHLHRPITLHVMHLQRPRNQFPRGFPANILLNAIRQILPPQRNPALIVIKLHILHKKTTKLHQIAPVISIKKRRIQSPNRLIQLLLILNAIEPSHLPLSPRTQHRQQQQQHPSVKSQLCHEEPFPFIAAPEDTSPTVTMFHIPSTQYCPYTSLAVYVHPRFDSGDPRFTQVSRKSLLLRGGCMRFTPAVRIRPCRFPLSAREPETALRISIPRSTTANS